MANLGGGSAPAAQVSIGNRAMHTELWGTGPAQRPRVAGVGRPVAHSRAAIPDRVGDGSPAESGHHTSTRPEGDRPRPDRG